MGQGVGFGYTLTLLSTPNEWIMPGEDVGSEGVKYLTQGHADR